MKITGYKFLMTAMAATSLTACVTTIEANDGYMSSKHSESLSIMTAEHPFQVSEFSVSKTEARLRNALKTRNLTLFTVIDHGQGAKSVGMDIGTSKLFIFGNPKAGTPLIKADPQLGLDLPMKMLIHTTEDGLVHVGYKDITLNAHSHDIEGQGERLSKIKRTLKDIVSETTGAS